MKKTMTKKGILTLTVAAAMIFAFSFTVQANAVNTKNLIHTENMNTPDGDELKCGGETSTAKTTEAKSGAVSADTKAKTTEGKCGEGKCGEGKCGEAKTAAPKSGAVSSETKAKTSEGKCGVE
jgi:uncharacterized low-complexity protein